MADEIDNFQLTDVRAGNKKITFIYENIKEGKKYYFIQYTKDVQLYGNNEYKDYEDEEVYWGKAILYDMESCFALSWAYDEYMFCIQGI